MRFVFTGYIRTKEFQEPYAWIHRLRAYLGVLEALSVDHDVISIEQIDYRGTLLHKGVQYHFMDFGKKRLLLPWRLHAFIRQLKPDVVVVHGTDSPLQVLQLRLRLGKNVRILVQGHGKGTPSGYKKFVQWVADRCIDGYLFTSAQMGKPWVDSGLIASGKKLHELMVGSSCFLPMEKAAARKMIAVNGDPIYLWAGRLNHNKDPFTVIKAFLRFQEECRNAKLYMVYQTEELIGQVTEFLSENDRNGCIRLVGSVTHSDMQLWYNAADFFISSSHFEVYGAVVVEAMSCRCIPILTDIPSFRKITGEGACGFFYPATDHRALWSILQSTLSVDREEELQKIKKQFEQALSFPAIANLLYDVAASL